MLGRGVDQILPHSCPPRLHEPWVTSALDYVAMAAAAQGAIPAPVGYDWVWGELAGVLRRRRPDVRLVNLETAVTTSDEPAAKGIHYRTHPENVRVLTAAGIDPCVLANNHVLDWGRAGLLETLDTLAGEGIAVAGAGRDIDGAARPAVVPLSGQHGGRPRSSLERSLREQSLREMEQARLVVVSIGGPDCGIPPEWAAGPRRPGVRLLEDYTSRSVDAVARSVEGAARPGDLVVASIHWGPNWGYEVPPEHRRFAHALLDRAGVHLVHGHSSHHPMAAELHGGRLVLYGCGDLVTDYEGISGHEEFRGDLALGYFAKVAPEDGRLISLEIDPFQLRRFRLERPTPEDRTWLLRRLRREYGRFDLGLGETETGAFRLLIPESES